MNEYDFIKEPFEKALCKKRQLNRAFEGAKCYRKNYNL